MDAGAGARPPAQIATDGSAGHDREMLGLAQPTNRSRKKWQRDGRCERGCRQHEIVNVCIGLGGRDTIGEIQSDGEQRVSAEKQYRAYQAT